LEELAYKMVVPLYKQKRWIIKNIDESENWSELHTTLKYWTKQTIPRDRRKK